MGGQLAVEYVGGGLTDLVVDQRASLREALQVIDREQAESVLVVDGDRRFLGILGEREALRAVLSGYGLDASAAPLVRSAPLTVPPTLTRAEVLDLMRAHAVRQVPVVDGDGRLLAVHRATCVLGGAARDNWVLVMAGGRGSRLGPLTDEIPKPMLPVAGRPILERIVLHLVGCGIRRVLLSVNYLGHVIEEHFGAGEPFGCRIDYVREDADRPLGTGGALGLLAGLGLCPDRPLVVMNGDLITDCPLGDLLDAHEAHGFKATVAVSQYSHQVPFGVVRTRDDGLVDIVEKPVSSWPVNAGVYALEPELLDRVPRDRLFPITALFDDCLRRGERVGVWQMPGDWLDIGRPAELARARGLW
ncbi:MAG: sugar phosphate nucleotidyltransferase [Mycobacteriales bacterium]